MSLFLSRTVRERLGLGEAFGVGGRIGLPTFYQARLLALELVTRGGELARGVSAGRLNALSELERLFRELAIGAFSLEDVDELRKLFRTLVDRFGAKEVDQLLTDFAREFLAFDLEAGWTAEIGSADDETVLRRAGEVLRELVVFAWVHQIPDAEGTQELLHEGSVVDAPVLESVAKAVEDWIEESVPEGDTQPTEVLHELTEATGLRGQLERAAERWPEISRSKKPGFVAALDLIEEEERPRFSPVGGAPPIELPTYAHLESTPARFSADEVWMAGVAIIAKNTFVWLDQLSRRYDRSIDRLDEIPDAELEALAAIGIDTLWLIGVWERSPASARVKQLCGNPEAVASAYSLRSYEIAEDLGGLPSLRALERRAERLGIRLAADMVPNHLGIDSDWIYDHPERFLSLSVPPYPTYTFQGPNLSDREGVEIRLEDHYYDRTDAAVVFQRRDTVTKTNRYVYHGNDGTTTPWNDTAQLDYSNALVRRAIIDQIVALAEDFPVIRFDAAMTLAKAHVQRLWFPKPGDAGAIPSRAEHAMTQDAFDALMPEEFWREAVDRVVAERPGTMILAEAFWLMESYFVRSLGVHRVYNSAFMNLLRDRKDKKYRNLLKETLQFDSRILERYVNFMTNPDEPSAREQFGTEARYFAVATLLATLPGTPLIGHGQIEGFGEKYGMEFRRPRLDEPVSEALVTEHARRVTPLLARRGLFARAEHFRLFDFVTRNGVSESVYAYTNRQGDERVLVLVNHSPKKVSGRIHKSAPTRPTGQGKAESTTLAEALSLRSRPVKSSNKSPEKSPGSGFWLSREAIVGRSMLRPESELIQKGLEVTLDPFETRTFVDFERVAEETEEDLRSLAVASTDGDPDLDAKVWSRRFVKPAKALRRLLDRERLIDLLGSADNGQAIKNWGKDFDALHEALGETGLAVGQTRPSYADFGATLLTALQGLESFVADLAWPESPRLQAARSRWLEQVSPSRLARLAAEHTLEEIRRWGSGGPRFLAIVRAERVLSTIEAAPDFSDKALAPTLPPGTGEYKELTETLREREEDTHSGSWWRIARVASLWLEPLGPTIFGPTWARRWKPEPPDVVIVGWCDVLDRIRSELADHP